MKRALPAILVLTTLTALSPAPIKDMQHGRLSPEKSDSQRSLEQNAARRGEVGSAPVVEDAPIVPTIEPGNDAADNVARASAAQNGEKAIKAATENMKKAKFGGGFNWLLGAVILGAGFGLTQVFKVWANKNLPEPGKFK